MRAFAGFRRRGATAGISGRVDAATQSDYGLRPITLYSLTPAYRPAADDGRAFHLLFPVSGAIRAFRPISMIEPPRARPRGAESGAELLRFLAAICRCRRDAADARRYSILPLSALCCRTTSLLHGRGRPLRLLPRSYYHLALDYRCRYGFTTPSTDAGAAIIDDWRGAVAIFSG